MKPAPFTSSPKAPTSDIDLVGIIVAVVWATTLSAISLVRSWNHWAGGLDLGLFDQAVWLLSKGRAPEVSFTGGSIFADHVSPVLLAFAPLYWLTSSSSWLLVGQAIALGVTVVPMRALARQLNGPTPLATIATVGSAPLLAAAVFDFHPLTLATPGVAWMVLGAVTDDRRAVLLSLGWVFVCRADASFIAVGIAFLAAPGFRAKMAGIGLLGSFAGLVTPHLLGEPRQTFDRYYADLGDTPFDALTHPWRMVNAIADPSLRSTLVIWLLPVAFLAVLRLRWLLALMVGGAPLLLSSWPGIALPWFHNGALMAPIAIGGALAALGRFAGDARRLAGAALLAGNAIALLVQSPLAPRAPAAVNLRDVLRPNGTNVEDTLALVPDHASVAAVNQLAASLAHRETIYVLPCPFPELVEKDDDEGLLDVCSGRRDRPDVVLATSSRLRGLRELGYVVEPSPTPGIVVARWRTDAGE